MNTTPLTILLTEDDPGHAELVQRNLQRSGFRNPILHFANGQELLDYVGKMEIDASTPEVGRYLVLLDIKMPVVDGIEALRRLKGDPRTEKIPVIMLTTTDDPREINRCYELGCSVYIRKPVEYATFVDAIQRLGLFLQIITVANLAP